MGSTFWIDDVLASQSQRLGYARPVPKDEEPHNGLQVTRAQIRIGIAQQQPKHRQIFFPTKETSVDCRRRLAQSMGAISSQSTGGKTIRVHHEPVKLLEPPEGIGLVPLRHGLDGAGVGVGQRLIVEATER